MKSDQELLRRYVEDRSEAAFSEFVRRHLNLVYFSALRQVRNNSALAEEITQSVFTDVARKASALSHHLAIAGWLHTSTRFAAVKALRAESRRQNREQEAYAMNLHAAQSDDQSNWSLLRPVIDDALHSLNKEDRELVLLRYFEEHSFGDIAGRLRIDEQTARKRIQRALDRLQTALARRGVTSTAAALAVAFASQAGVAAPAGFAASVTGAALAGSAASIGTWPLISMSISKLQFGIASLLVLAGITSYSEFYRRGQLAELKSESEKTAKLEVKLSAGARLALAPAAGGMADRNPSPPDAEITKLDQAVLGELHRWVEKVHAIQETMRTRSDLWIPEMKFVTEAELFDAVKDKDVLGDPQAMENSIGTLRLFAKSGLVDLLVRATTRFASQNPGRLPRDTAELKAYLVGNEKYPIAGITDDMLARYKYEGEVPGGISPRGPSDVAPRSVFREVEPSSPLDGSFEFDSGGSKRSLTPRALSGK